jgi:cytochrome c oxidase accessory protein FixG
MQGVLVDRSTIVISYDYLRGEPRGVQKKGSTRETTGLGDCIDCHSCVDVCPTGIDIRNGTQLECVNCTACIDACNSIMKRVDKPTGLIRYASENEIAFGKKQKFSFRTLAYSGVLVILFAFFVTVLATRSEVDVVVLRTPGVLYQQAGPDSLSNLYNIKVINKTRKDKLVNIKITSHNGSVTIIGGAMMIPAEAKTESVLFVKMAKADLTEQKTKVQLDILSNEKVIDNTRVTFISPKK